MGWITKALGLTLKVPDVGDKNWASGFLTDFVEKISAHDHTGSPNGLQIASGAIATGAVTAAKLGTDAVETAKIKDLNVTTAKIAAANITAAKLATDVRAMFLLSTGRMEYNTTEAFYSLAGEALPVTLPAAISLGVSMPHAGTLRGILLAAVGYNASQDCDTVFKLYKNGVYASVTGSVTCVNNITIQTTLVPSTLTFVAGDVFTISITGGGASGANGFSLSASVSQG